MEFLAEYGFIGLFLAAFLAATILPLSSEIVLSVLLASGLSPVVLVAVATAGNVLGALTNYGLGYWANQHWLKRWLRLSDNEFERAEHRFQKYGVLALCLAWVPIIGDPLTILAGALRIKLSLFITLVTLGKCLRYVAIAYLAVEVL